MLGLGGSMRYRESECMFTEREMKARIRRLYWKLRKSGGFDILLTHAPALDFGDGDNLPHRGFQCFVDLMDKYHPQVMVHGHMHPEYAAATFRRELLHGETRIINANQRVYFDVEPRGKIKPV